MNPETEHLVPRPQNLLVKGESCPLPAEPFLFFDTESVTVESMAKRLTRDLEGRGFRPRLRPDENGGRPEAEPGVRLRIDPEVATRPQSYSLDIGPRGIEITGGDHAGLFYGTSTLRQWIDLHERGRPGGGLSLSGLQVQDWPDFPHRGVVLDISRDKVPTLHTLFHLVDLLAGWKINQLQLYMEHTFAYRGHEVVWSNASPLTGEDIRELDAYCRDRFVELVPNQNSFGHLHRWLIHEPYRHLAECPDGVRHPFSSEVEPFSLCPEDPGSLELLGDLYEQLLPNFTSRLFNVGLDETVDLGQGRSAEACRSRGTERVYLQFLKKVHELVCRWDRQMQFWGDIVLKRPDLIAELPRDVVALDWGYEANHPFGEECQKFADSGLAFYVCPGTSSWNSLAGRAQNALLNIGSAAVHGKEAGAQGLLITDWGDFGHLQPLPVSYLGFAAGAGFAWNVAAAREPLKFPVADLLDLHAFRDRAGVIGNLALELGNAYRDVGATPPNGSALFFLLLFAEDGLAHRRFRGLDSDGLRTGLEGIQQAADALDATRMEGEDADLVVREFRWVADLLTVACELGMHWLQAGRHKTLAKLPPTLRRSLAEKLDPLIGEHREIWLARNRSGGLADSARRLQRLRSLLEG